MSITTYADAHTQYLDNLSYRREASVAKAWLFYEACSALILLSPKRSRAGNDNEVETDPVRLEKQMEEALQWISSNPESGSSASAGSVRFPDFSEFRG